MANFDAASLGKYLRSQLTIFDTERFYQAPQMDYWATRGEYIPSRGDLPFGAEDVQSWSRQNVGMAALWDGRSYDIPLVDLQISGFKAPAFMVVAGAEWSMADISRNQIAEKAGMMPRLSLVESKMEAIREAIDRRLHFLVLVGFPDAGAYGFLNNTTIEVDDQTATTPLQLTPAELYEWWLDRITTFKKASRLPYASIYVYVSDEMLNKLSLPIDDNTGDTPFMRLTNADRGIYIGGFMPITELSNSELQDLGVVSDGTEELAIMGDLMNINSLRRHFAAVDRSDINPKDTGLHFGVSGFAGTSVPVFKVPEKFRYVKYDPTVV